MIYSLTGKVSILNENTIIVDTGAMAFEVICSSFTAYALSSKPEPQKVLTYLQVREDGMTLFGFSSQKEKSVFTDLIQISGVGPKMASTILSGLPVDEIIKAIATSDVKTLSSIKGLGKKTAERIALELSSKFGAEDALESIMSSDTKLAPKQALKKEVEETAEVLVSMGMSKNDAVELAKSNYADGMTSESLVVCCLKNMHK